MSDRKKGFDPLSSLFDAPAPAAVGHDGGRGLGSISEPGLPSDVPGQGIAPGLELEDAPTEMAPMPAAAELPEPAGEVAGAGPLKSKPSGSDAVEFIGELPASDDWTESKPEALFSLNQLPTPDPDEEAAPRYGQRLSRVERLAARAVRPKSALEAAREAVDAEEAVQERASQTLTDRIQSLVEASLPGVGDLDVKAAKIADEREGLIALW